MKFLKFIWFFIFLWTISAHATHNRAGEITYRQISELTYEITLVTYTYTPSAANETRDFLPIVWGDNTNQLIPRVHIDLLPDDYSRNIYRAEHTYPGPGIYTIVMEDPNRNDGVNNIPGSVNVVFSIATTLKIDASLGFNTTPVLLNPPLDKAIVGQTFIHNPGAYDAEGDSISYRLTICRQDYGQVIPGYTFPPASTAFYVDSIIGDLVWDAPTTVGVYNVAMLIEEWRNKVKIGVIIRDMQIEVSYGNDIKPEITPVADYCIEAGQSLGFLVEATDVDGDVIELSATGGPFETSPSATFSILSSISGFSTGQFEWQTECSNIRKSPYQAIFKAEELYRTIPLVDFESSQIWVVAPAPNLLQLSPTFNSIELDWSASICNTQVAFDIYRKISPSGWTPSNCELGIPSGIGFEKMASTLGNETHYVDANSGLGLQQGFEYCYRIVARYSDGAESYASNELCTQLELGNPLITKVSVDSTHQNQGEILVHWAQFKDFDTLVSPGPYHYLIYRSTGLVGSQLQLIDSTLSQVDTTFLDRQIDTKSQIYSYSIEMYSNSPTKRERLGNPQLASSHFLSAYTGDRKVHLSVQKNTPWVNDTMLVYRESNFASHFDSIGYTLNGTFVDSTVLVGQTYRYYYKSLGYYANSVLPYRLSNLSQQIEIIPLDSIAPCAPQITVQSNCDSYYNSIKWQVADSCKQDIFRYKVYYSSTLEGTLSPIWTSSSASDSIYEHFPNTSIAGCYWVSAVDSFGNESKLLTKTCVDYCTYYQLPNVFTPNGDGQNDLVIPSPYRFVEKVEMKIYNRWGNLVFQTNNPDIRWDGRYMENNKMLSPGVYYYVCDVYEYRLSGIEVRALSGFIQLADPGAALHE